MLASNIKCPVCGSSTRLRISKKDGSKFHVCVNYPDCKGKVAFDEDWDDDWDEKKPVSQPVPARTQQRRVPKRNVAPPKRRPSLVVIISVVAIAIIAIAGTIYAVVASRNQETVTSILPTPTSTQTSTITPTHTPTPTSTPTHTPTPTSTPTPTPTPTPIFNWGDLFPSPTQIPTPTPTPTPTPIVFLQIGQPYIASDGLTVTLSQLDITEKTGSYQYVIEYTLVNNTPDRKIDEGSFTMDYADGSGRLPQYGFFGSLFPGDTITRSYTFEELKSKPFGMLEYGPFSFEWPPPETLKWKVEIP